MRSEQEMFDLILSTAREDERIRAVVMNGSRANPNAPRDIFQDYDIVYLVTDVEPFTKNLEWIQRFGEMMILQMPEDMDDPAAEHDGSFQYLMQFMDGTRIDLGIVPVENYHNHVRDSLSILLLDKDGIVVPFPPPDESTYLPAPPTAKLFDDCCNEFWWVSPYAAKGLWRNEFPYARHVLDLYVREMLDKMLVWYIGMNTGFQVNPGKFGKYYQRYLEPELWALLLKTYADASEEHTWEAIFAMCELFRKVAIPVAEHFGFAYPFEDDQRVFAFLQRIQTLPRDAKEIYES